MEQFQALDNFTSVLNRELKFEYLLITCSTNSFCLKPESNFVNMQFSLPREVYY